MVKEPCWWGILQNYGIYQVFLKNNLRLNGVGNQFGKLMMPSSQKNYFSLLWKIRPPPGTHAKEGPGENLVYAIFGNVLKKPSNTSFWIILSVENFGRIF